MNFFFKEKGKRDRKEKANWEDESLQLQYVWT